MCHFKSNENSFKKLGYKLSTNFPFLKKKKIRPTTIGKEISFAENFNVTW